MRPWLPDVIPSSNSPCGLAHLAVVPANRAALIGQYEWQLHKKDHLHIFSELDEHIFTCIPIMGNTSYNKHFSEQCGSKSQNRGNTSSMRGWSNSTAPNASCL